MNEVQQFVDTTEGRLASRQDTKEVLAATLGNQFSAEAKKLFWGGLSKITNEDEMIAAMIISARETGTEKQIRHAYKFDRGGKLITRLSQKIVKTLSSTDRTLRNNVSWSGELIWMRFSLTCMLVLVWREDNHTLL